MIKMLTGIAGADFSYSPGEQVELDAETEQRLIDSGQAEAVTKPAPKKAPAKATAKKGG